MRIRTKYIPVNLAGFTLLELALVLSAAAVIAAAVTPVFIKKMYFEAARKASIEMVQIQEAARSFYIKKNTWPEDIAALQADGYLDPAWLASNPFGKLYSVKPVGQALLVQSEVPKAVAGVMVNLLPMVSVEGLLLSSAITIPGVAADRLPIGGIISWSGSALPEGWLPCDGREVTRTDHAALFAVIGIVYGVGDGATTFNLPDLRGRTVVGLDNMGGSAANVIHGAWGEQLGGKAGEEEHVLSLPEMPSHTHTYGFATVGGNYDGHSSPLFNAMEWRETAAVGGNRSHNNVQPSMALYWIIKG